MTNQEHGVELNQISRKLFNNAANYWLWSFGLEVIGGFGGVFLAFANLTDDLQLASALAILVILAIAYVLRIIFEGIYDNAGTMRRQSIFTEALDLPISPTEFSAWRLSAGKKVLSNIKLKPRDADYYATKQSFGGKRLLEMTIESAFYTRHLYSKLRDWFWGFTVVGGIIAFVMMVSTPFEVISSIMRFQLVYSLYLTIPVLISLDFLGWAIRLGRLSSSIEKIERYLEQYERNPDISVPEVMKLVTEYNCQVACGFPVPDFAFHHWHDEIRDLWNERHNN